MDRPLDPRSLANYILAVRRHFGYETSNLELQKIAYFAYGKYLVSHNEKLCDGYFEAWEHGPVHPYLYREFKGFGANPITKRCESTNLATGDIRLVPPPTDAKRRTHIVEVIIQLRHLNASQLREKSHAPNGPWHKVRTQQKRILAAPVVIPDDLIREEFRRHIVVAPTATTTEEPEFEDYPPTPDRSR